MYLFFPVVKLTCRGRKVPDENMCTLLGQPTSADCQSAGYAPRSQGALSEALFLQGHMDSARELHFPRRDINPKRNKRPYKISSVSPSLSPRVGKSPGVFPSFLTMSPCGEVLSDRCGCRLPTLSHWAAPLWPCFLHRPDELRALESLSWNFLSREKTWTVNWVLRRRD